MQGLKFSHKVLRAVKKDVRVERNGVIEHTVNRAGIFEERMIGGFAEAELLGTAGAEVTFFHRTLHYLITIAGHQHPVVKIEPGDIFLEDEVFVRASGTRDIPDNPDGRIIRIINEFLLS